MRLTEPAPAKLNLALHVRGKLPDGRHALETVFAFCTDGDILTAEAAKHSLYVCETGGEFAEDIGSDNVVRAAYFAMQEHAQTDLGVAFTLDKRLPVASGIGGGSADAAAALRLLTRLWGIDPIFATEVAPGLGSDVPACLLSMTARGTEAGDRLELFQGPPISGAPVLLVNPRVPLSTAKVFSAWDGVDRGPLGDWRQGRNDLEAPARTLVPEIGQILDWLGRQDGANFVRMSGSGATCFALFDTEAQRDAAASACPSEWWHLATFLR
ncbi:4-(cytidine 5'-diphospho)-2-C-methyl-D-erythritol kinase [Sphingomonas sp.]|uniref:4-(cytidine 5'-diphospho)-2-C-methyl-D-erythritol kinase n=1 Tax=Sphingomonas sp. TaxID=28214 RepID=UPI0025E83F04|nr:4-(cytidine 5'-diphospho)-2-C-methyl-D-erythritol kinase [Sphingomonas sp.]